MPSFRGHLPLAVVSIVLSVAVYILYKELRAVKNQAAIGATFATAFQEQQQHMYQHLPPQFLMEPAPTQPPTQIQRVEAEENAENRDDDDEEVDGVIEPTPARSKAKVQQKRQ